MRQSLDLLNDIRIASPCHESWESMTGDDRARYCRAWAKIVYNLAGMTADAATELIVAREGKICVRLYRRHDGTVLTADCPVGRSARLRRRVRNAVLAAASWLGLISAAGCNERRAYVGECVMGDIAPQGPAHEIGPMPREIAE